MKRRSVCFKPRKTPFRERVLIRCQQNTSDDDENDESAEEEFNPMKEAVGRRRGVDAGAKMNDISLTDVSELQRETNETALMILESQTSVVFLFTKLPKLLLRRAEDYLSKPQHLILSSAICVLFGFFSSTSATTIIGSVADWDPLAALVLLLITESFTKWYYRTELRKTLKTLFLLNAFKLGIYYGMAVDAFKLST